MPMSAPNEPKVEAEGDDVKVTIGPRVYQVLWLEKSLARGRMQVNVKVSGANVRGEYRYHGEPECDCGAVGRHGRGQRRRGEG
jgi:hypothetical protein